MSTLASMGLDPTCLEALLHWQRTMQDNPTKSNGNPKQSNSTSSSTQDSNAQSHQSPPSHNRAPMDVNHNTFPKAYPNTTTPISTNFTMSMLHTQATKNRYGLSRVQPREVKQRMERELQKETSHLKAWASNPIQMDRPLELGCLSHATWEKEETNIKSYVGFAYFKFNVNVATLKTYFNTHIFMAFITFLMDRGVKPTTLASHTMTAMRSCCFWISTNNNLVGVENPHSILKWLKTLR